MAQPNADISREFKLHPAINGQQPVDANTTIFMGSGVSRTTTGTNMEHPLVAGEPFGGFAFGPAYNVPVSNLPQAVALGNNGLAIGAAGALDVQVRQEGILTLPLASMVGGTGIADRDKPVYMSDGNTFTLTATGNTEIGVVRAFTAGRYEIYFKASGLRGL